MKQLFPQTLTQLSVSLFLLACASAANAAPVSCGTVAAPSACVLGVGGQVQYAFSNFALVVSNASGTQPVTGAEIGLSIDTGGGLSAVLSVTKLVTAANPNVVFLANSGDTNAFSFSYDVEITPLSAGTVLLINPAEVNIITSSFSQNGSGAVQFVLSGAPICQANTVTTSDSCTLPAATTTSLTGIGNIVSLSGNAGNVSIGTFSNTLNASFTPTPTGVPEPSTCGLLAAGLALVYRFRRR